MDRLDRARLLAHLEKSSSKRATSHLPPAGSVLGEQVRLSGSIEKTLDIAGEIDRRHSEARSRRLCYHAGPSLP